MPERQHIRSFVRRDTRATAAQKKALAEHSERFSLPRCATRTDFAAAFGRDAPLTLEIGSGDGACTLAMAERYPDENFVANEVYRPGLGNLLLRTARAETSNIRICDLDAVEFIASLREPVFDRVMIFFPDPWPKKRHHKRRLLRPEFLRALAAKVRANARVFIATDNADYALAINEHIEASDAWRSLAASEWAPRYRERPQTRFERKAAVAKSAVFDIAIARR